MSQSNPVSNPFGTGPGGGTPEAQNPFQIVGGGGGQPPQNSQQRAPASPFEAVGDQGSEGASPPQAPRANPFQIAGPEGPPAQRPPGQGGQPEGGFDMKGFPAGPAPVNQLKAAPVGEEAETQKHAVDPFAGMDLPQISGEPSGKEKRNRPVEREEVEDFAAKAPPRERQAESKPAPEPQPPREPEPARRPEPAPRDERPTFTPVKPTARNPVTSETKQLELRAIFGVDHELDHQELMQRARGLPGILHVAKVNAKESAALETLQACASKLGLDDDEPIVMSCPTGFIDFLSFNDSSLAILRNEDYAPGVRETLMIVARELDKL